jgi:hypothetical protein
LILSLLLILHASKQISIKVNTRPELLPMTLIPMASYHCNFQERQLWGRVHQITTTWESHCCNEYCCNIDSFSSTCGVWQQEFKFKWVREL